MVAARALPAKDILEHVAPELQLTALRMAQPGIKVPEQLMKLDEQGMTNQYKVGVLYCKDGQSTEEEMYNNQSAISRSKEMCHHLGANIPAVPTFGKQKCIWQISLLDK
ncbi:Signal-induced proliferation-associated 1-like protein 2, partial [Desmophyllum pertusum]